MQRFLLSLFSLLFFQCAVFAQSAIYTRQNARVKPQDVVQLIGKIGDHHHLLIVRYRQKPLLYVYDRLLNLADVKELPLLVSDNYDVQILPFENYYYLITHQPATQQYQWWKIDALGHSRNVSTSFTQLIHTQLLDTNVTLRFSVYQQQLYIMTNVYYPHFGKIVTTIVQTDSALNTVQKQQVSFTFNKEKERLQQMLLVDKDNIALLKTAVNDSSDHLLELVKINLPTKEIVSTQYNIQSYFFSQPRFFYAAADSVFYVYSLISMPFTGYQQQTSILINRLDYALNQLLPATLMKVKTPYSFLLIHDALPWLDVSWSYRYNFNYSRSYNWLRQNYYGNFSGPDEILYYNSQGANGKNYLNNEKYNSTRRIKLLLLNSEFKVIKDSTIKNDTKSFTIHPEGYGKFTVHNTSYLLLKQDFPSKGTGLVLFYKNKENQLVSEDVQVYERYEYLLPQVQALPDHSFLLPYTTKQEVGIVFLKGYAQ